ncbi:MAG: hypothetical protein ACP5IK_03060 [Candidatus Micrarchaeia archaeon]
MLAVLFLELISLAELSYVAYASPKKLWRFVAPLSLALLASFFYHIPIQLFVLGVVLLSFFAIEIGSAANFVALPFALYALFLLKGYSPLMLLLALLSLFPEFLVSREKHKATSRIESNRDILHISLGVLLIASLLFFGLSITLSLITFAVCAALSLGTYASMTPSTYFSKFLKGLERSNAPFGFGAFWLAFSLLLAAAFANQFAPVVFIALMFGDPSATLVGIRIRNRHRIPYAKEKSIEGALAFFAITAFIAYFFVGLYSILFALVGAAVESISKSIDDNLSIGVVLVALALLLQILGAV